MVSIDSSVASSCLNTEESSREDREEEDSHHRNTHHVFPSRTT